MLRHRDTSALEEFLELGHTRMELTPCPPDLGGSRAVPGEILTLWVGHTIPGSCLNPRDCHPSWHTGHDGWLIAGGCSQLLEVFVVVMDSATQLPPHLPPSPPLPLSLKTAQDGGTTTEHEDSAWFLWRSHPDPPSDHTSPLILGFWGCRTSSFWLVQQGGHGPSRTPRTARSASASQDLLSPHQLYLGSRWTQFQE